MTQGSTPKFDQEYEKKQVPRDAPYKEGQAVIFRDGIPHRRGFGQHIWSVRWKSQLPISTMLLAVTAKILREDDKACLLG